MTGDSQNALTFGSAATMFISAGLGYIGGLITSRAQARLEYDKWLRARRDDVRRDTRTALAEVASDLAALAHTIMWFSYNMADANSAPDQHAIQEYSAETNHLISDVVSAQVRLAALDRIAFDKITPSVSEAIHLSEQVDDALDVLREHRDQGRTAILECNSAALSYIKDLPGRIANLIGDKTESLEAS